MFRGKKSTMPTRRSMREESSNKIPTNRLSMNTAADSKKRGTMVAQAAIDHSVVSLASKRLIMALKVLA
jgi:hypothetical protein